MGYIKYICTKDPDGIEEIFIFPPTVDHDAMAEVLTGIKNQTRDPWHRVLREPISAGFVTDDGQCFGKSLTLDLTSREHIDTELLKEQYI